MIKPLAVGLTLFAWAAPVASDTPPPAAPGRGEEVEIRGNPAAGPGPQVPPPGLEKAVIDEVIQSLDVFTAEHKPETPNVSVKGGTDRLERPFPEPPFLVFSPRSIEAPYQGWTFQVLEGPRVVWSLEGETRLSDKIEWDGSGAGGEPAASAGRTYSFRFTGRNGAQTFVLKSEPLTLKSLSYQEVLGGTRLEVANAVLFKTARSIFAEGSQAYLTALGERMRRVHSGTEPYRLSLYSPRPSGTLAARRAEALRRHLSRYLVINPKMVEVELLSSGTKGEITACALPAERGQTIRTQ